MEFVNKRLIVYICSMYTEYPTMLPVRSMDGIRNIEHIFCFIERNIQMVFLVQNTENGWCMPESKWF